MDSKNASSPSFVHSRDLKAPSRCSTEQSRILGITLWDTEENGRLAGIRLNQERHTGETEMGAASAVVGMFEVMSRL